MQLLYRVHPPHDMKAVRKEILLPYWLRRLHKVYGHPDLVEHVIRRHALDLGVDGSDAADLRGVFAECDNGVDLDDGAEHGDLSAKHERLPDFKLERVVGYAEPDHAECRTVSTGKRVRLLQGQSIRLVSLPDIDDFSLHGAVLTYQRVLRLRDGAKVYVAPGKELGKFFH